MFASHAIGPGFDSRPCRHGVGIWDFSQSFGSPDLVEVLRHRIPLGKVFCHVFPHPTQVLTGYSAHGQLKDLVSMLRIERLRHESVSMAALLVYLPGG